MVSLFKLTSTFLAIVASVNSLAIQSRGTDVDGVVKLDFRSVESPSLNLRKRSAPVSADLAFTYGSYYVIDLIAGSNSKSVPVLLDTGSKDLIFVPADTGVPGTGTFSTSDSSTLKLYGSQDSGLGPANIYSDTVGLSSSVELSNFYFGILDTATSGTPPLLGVQGGGSTATSFSYNLKQQNFIATNGLSVYLNSPDATTGSIIFGGIDTEKYSGNLVSLDSGTDTVGTPLVSGFTFSDGTNVATNGYAILDTGSTNSVYPQNFIDALVKYFGADSNGNIANYNSAWDNENLTISFQNGAVTVQVPYSDLLTQSSSGQWQLFPYSAGGSDGSLILGQRWLRRFYVSWNYDTNKISIAQASYGTGSNIVPI